MAKIYETKEDLAREQLSQDITRSIQNQSLAAGMTGVGGAMLAVGVLKKAPPKVAVPAGANFLERVWHHMRHDPIRWKTTGAILAAVGAVGVWHAGKRAKEAQHELEKLGPEVVQFPPMEALPGECLPCKLKEAITPRSLREYAAKPDDMVQVR